MPFTHMGRNGQPFFMLAILDGHYFWKSTTQLMAVSEFLCNSTENTNTQHYLLQQSCGFLIQVLPNPKPAYLVKCHVMLPQVTWLQQTLHTHIPYVCVVPRLRKDFKTNQSCADMKSDTKQNKWK